MGVGGQTQSCVRGPKIADGYPVYAFIALSNKRTIEAQFYMLTGNVAGLRL